MHQIAGRLGTLGTILGILAALTSCGGNDLTLPGDVGPARITKVDGDNQNGSAGAELPQPLKIQVLDQRGVPVRNQPVAFSVVDDVPGAAVTGDASTGNDGTASARWVLGATSGSQKVSARVVGDGLPDSLEATFQAVAGSSDAARIHLEDGDGQSGAVGTALDKPLVVRVTDQFGNPVAGVEVSWTAESGNVDPRTSTSNADGKAQTAWVLGSSTGAQLATASSAGLGGSPVSFTADARPGNADKLVRLSGDNQSGKPGQDLTAPLVIRLVDRNGNGVPGRAVSWVVGTGGGRVSSESNTTGGNGEAQTRWTLGSSTGTNTVNAVVSGVGFVTFTATATDAGNGGGGGGGGSGGEEIHVSQIAFAVQPSDTQRDQAISPGVLVVVLDQAGSRVTSGDFEIKLELQGDRGKLKGHSTQRTRSGVAAFDDLTVDQAGEYRLRASTGGLPAIESQSFKVLEGDDHHGGHHHHHGED